MRMIDKLKLAGPVAELGCYLISKPLPRYEFEQAFLEQFQVVSKEPHLRRVGPG